MRDFRFVTIGSQPTVKPDELLWSNTNPSGALDYFVDLNRAASGDGLSWDTAFGTIAEAITASNISIGLTANRWWARRNRIWVLGDGITESLTVLPEKCDIIGLGSDLYPFPRVSGAHTIALAKVSCRFINMGFQATGTGDLFVAPAGCHGLQFIDCTFTPSSAGNTKCLEITNCAHVLIKGCKILSATGVAATGLFGRGISIEGTASIHDLNIEDNFIFAVSGIVIGNGTLHGSFIRNNVIRVIGDVAIVDSSSDVACIDNRFISDAAGLVAANFVTWNPLLAVGNLGTSNTAQSGNVPAAVVLTS